MQKGTRHTELSKLKISVGTTKAWASKTRRKRRAALLRRVWKTPEYRAKQREARRAYEGRKYLT